MSKPSVFAVAYRFAPSMKSAILLVVEDDIRCSRYVRICFSWRGGSGPAHFKSLPKPQSGLVPDRRYRKFGELGAKKVFSYNAMKRFLVWGHSRPPKPTFSSPDSGLAEGPARAKSQI